MTNLLIGIENNKQWKLIILNWTSFNSADEKVYCEEVEWTEEKKHWPMVDTIIILYLISAAKYKSGEIWYGLTPKDMRDGVPYDT